ncbi:MAG TPA: DUF4349 domain-containing protein [Acidimicrobiia bacterium]|nr:DUF4349 domain-containing protein [Acidimicrobiia bacterium]
MGRQDTTRRTGWARILLVVMAVSVVVAACSANDDATTVTTTASAGGESGLDEGPAPEPGARQDGIAYDVVLDDGMIVFEQVGSTFDAKIIRDGSVELRIEPGSFGTTAGQVRAIAADLGGYIASGESRVEQFEDDRYAVGWYTIRIPSDRFDEAVARVEQLGERVSASLSSQDVTEEYVDLEGRLDYWREQEAFYLRLMEEATTIEELVTVQTRMQDVLLNIEQIEGRLRYLDSRTDFATLTVGLTEVPDTAVPPVDPKDPGPIAEAFDQAGEVLLATVGFMIIATAVAIPIAIVVAVAYGIFRLFTRPTRRGTAAS